MKRVGHKWMRAVNLKTRKLMDCCGTVPGGRPSRSQKGASITSISGPPVAAAAAAQELPRHQMWL